MPAENTLWEVPDAAHVGPRRRDLILAVTRVNPATQVCQALGDAQMFESLAQYYTLVTKEIATAEGLVIKPKFQSL